MLALSKNHTKGEQLEVHFCIWDLNVSVIKILVFRFLLLRCLILDCDIFSHFPLVLRVIIFALFPTKGKSLKDIKIKAI